MIYVILISVYTYILVKIILSYSSKSSNVNRWLSPRLTLIEFFLFGIVIAYLFHHYYFQQSDFEYFIIPAQLIWITFIACLFLLGIGLGFKFMLGLMNNFIPDNQQINFAENKKVYEIFAQIWVNLGILMIFFSYSLMEISRPTEELTSVLNTVAIYTLSAALGIINFLVHRKIHSLVQKFTTVSMIIISICLSLFVYETRSDFSATLPVTISFIIFNSTFFLSLLIASRFIKEKTVIEEDILIPNHNYNSYIPQEIPPSEEKPMINFANECKIKLPPTENIQKEKPQNISIPKSHEDKLEKPEIRVRISGNTSNISLRSLRLN